METLLDQIYLLYIKKSFEIKHNGRISICITKTRTTKSMFWLWMSSRYFKSWFPKQVHESKHPFESTSSRGKFIDSGIPGPGMYVSIKEPCHKFYHSFGGKMNMKLGVDLKCCSKNTDVCKICNKKLTGDYWHLKNKLFLCRSCMNKEYETQTTYKRRELQQFRKIRDCSNIHRHENTMAKIWLMHPSDIAKWMHREAYLSTYLKG
ncbi:uncharacterized protein LOC105661993 isoform X4 [Megachile rotundata]|uniref:uncharacterized protein LOC105661993 isoform X4 n=1 Tax=Megachile rotundata TaxID=143995 RepID=UPI003FCF71A7